MSSFWGALSLAIPLATAALGVALVLSSRHGTGDYAARLGAGVLFLISIAIACALGAVAGMISLLRAEPLPWLAAIGLITNLFVIAPIFRLLLSE